MKPYSIIRLYGVVFPFVLLSPHYGAAQAAAITRFPADRAVGVNPDTHLVLTFATAPTLGKSGQIRIYDAAGHQLVDTLDLSIPAGPDPSRRITAPAPPTQLDASIPTSPTTTTPAVRTIPADLHNYQLTTIGGLADFHFYPVIIHGNVATIYPHNNVLHYGHKYIVQIDPGVLTPASGAFAGFATDSDWTFATKAAPPAANSTRVVVAADGSGDFNTVQGAIDFVPANPREASHHLHQERHLRGDRLLPRQGQPHHPRRGPREGADRLQQQQRLQPAPARPKPPLRLLRLRLHRH